MAVLQMKRISICALKSDRKKILEILQRQEVIEIDDILVEDNVFSKADTASSQLLFEKSQNEARQALEIINTYDLEKKSLLAMLEGRKEFR